MINIVKKEKNYDLEEDEGVEGSDMDFDQEFGNKSDEMHGEW